MVEVVRNKNFIDKNHQCDNLENAGIQKKRGKSFHDEQRENN